MPKENFDYIDSLERLGYSTYIDSSIYRSGIIDELHIDIYSNGKYNLFGRIIETDVEFVKEKNRFTIFNKNKDVLMDIDIDDIGTVMKKTYGESCREILFAVGNMRHRMILCGSKSKNISYH